ncbi:MAG: efflux RND transporter periplasmic adaptor subunit [Cyclobacteriaceae bacterium]
MKRNHLLLAITLLSACGGKEASSLEDVLTSNNIEQIRKKKQELNIEQLELSTKIGQLDAKLSSLSKNKNIPLVTSFVLSEEKFIHYVELQGDVKTKQNVLIYPEVSGLLQKVYVKEGQYVKKGQILASIDNGGLKEQLEQVKARAELAKIIYEKQKSLWENNIGSEIQFLQTKADHITQENSQKQLEKQLAKFQITAPFSGTIDDVIKEEGTIVSPGPGSEIFRIVNLNNMYVESSIPETYLNSITLGKKVIIDFPILGSSVTSRVRQVGSFIDPANRTFKVEVSVPSGTKNVKPNLNSRIQINDYTNEKAILIPLSIISENADGEQYVYSISNKEKKDNTLLAKAEQKIIKVGKTEGDKIEVISGVVAGDEIIQEGARSVKDGQNVKLISIRK